MKKQLQCEKNVTVNFTLTSRNVENMEADIYGPEQEEFEEDILLLGHVSIHDGLMNYTVPDNLIWRNLHLIGIECINRVLNNPRILLG